MSMNSKYAKKYYDKHRAEILAKQRGARRIKKNQEQYRSLLKLRQNPTFKVPESHFGA